jgi:acetyl-CoA carboxylase biotin carboxyl carrier protein
VDQETTLPEDLDLQEVKELVRLVEKHNLAELTVEENGVTITVKGAVQAPTQVIHQTSIPVSSVTDLTTSPVQAPAEALMPPTQPAQPEPDNLVKIESPMVGVFYRASSPDAPAFVEVGDEIEVGQTIGLIEAMKVFSEIPSEVAGKVVEIPAENGKLVQQGQVLVVVQKLEPEVV